MTLWDGLQIFCKGFILSKSTLIKNVKDSIINHCWMDHSILQRLWIFPNQKKPLYSRIYTCLYAEFLSRGEHPRMTEEVFFYRLKIISEIYNKKIEHPRHWFTLKDLFLDFYNKVISFLKIAFQQCHWDDMTKSISLITWKVPSVAGIFRYLNFQITWDKVFNRYLLISSWLYRLV